MCETNQALIVVVFDENTVWRLKATQPVSHANVTLLGKPCQTIGEFANDLFFETTEFIDINDGLTKGDAVRGHLMSFLNNGRGMQQGFGWDATHVQTNASKI